MRNYKLQFSTIAWDNMTAWVLAESLEEARKAVEERFGKITIKQCNFKEVTENDKQ